MVSVGGGGGGGQAQKAMRSIGEHCKVKFMQHPSMMVKRWGGNNFDQEGNLIDEKIKESLKTYLNSLAFWIDKNKRQ